MPVIALPLVWPVVVAAAEAVAFIASAAIVGYGVHKTIEVVDETLSDREKATADAAPVQRCPERPCPPCAPPAGTVRVERIDRVPPSQPHYPCPGDHAHLVQRNQNRRCDCFWNNARPDVMCLAQGGTPSIPMK